MTRHDDIVAERRAEAGLPVLVCPNCGERGAHYVPASLAEPGHFECVPAARMSWQIGLDFPRPPAGLSMNDRPRHWSVKSKSTALVRGLVANRARAAGIPPMERCRVDVEWIVPDARKRDTDNLAPFLKAIYDAIGSDRGVGARLVPDDDPAHMDKPAATIRLERGARAHFIITITRKEGT